CFDSGPLAVSWWDSCQTHSVDGLSALDDGGSSHDEDRHAGQREAGRIRNLMITLASPAA
ncbi:MAG: hypothetical protein WBO15_09895, partial [Gammaproteobacteria bacterium]